jgi:hypothetical protein
VKTAAGYAGSGLDYQRQLYSPLYDSPQEEGESHLRKNEPAGVFTKVAVGVSKGATENLLICCRKVDYRGTGYAERCIGAGVGGAWLQRRVAGCLAEFVLLVIDSGGLC